MGTKRGSIASDLRASTRLAWLPSRPTVPIQGLVRSHCSRLTGVVTNSMVVTAVCPLDLLSIYLLKSEYRELGFSSKKSDCSCT